MTSPTLQILWRPGCGFCAALRADLQRRGVQAEWRNIWQDDDARELVRRHNGGNETVPTVIAGDIALTNPSGAEVAALVGR